MSNAIFPILPGLAWSVMRSVEFATSVARSTSRREFTIANQLYPIWTFKLPYEFLRGGAPQEVETLIGFIMQRQGKFDDFLYRYPNDFLVTQQGIGVGDGTTTVFPLLRSIGGAVEPLQAVDGLSQVRVAGTVIPFGAGAGHVLADASAPNAQNAILGTPPAPGQVVDWSGTFYYRCRFTNDKFDFEEFYKQFHKTGSIEFRTHR